MRSMATPNGSRSPRLFVAVMFAATAFVALSAWDEEDLEELRAEAREVKRHALMFAIEESGHREYFASDFHCRVPLKGERLEMQHVGTNEPGRGYRCTYRIMMQPPGVVPVANVTWSRSPGLTETWRLK